MNSNGLENEINFYSRPSPNQTEIMASKISHFIQDVYHLTNKDILQDLGGIKTNER